MVCDKTTPLSPGWRIIGELRRSRSATCGLMTRATLPSINDAHTRGGEVRDRWITKVDVAWNPEWVGTEQARTFKVQGDRLQVLTPWRVMPNWPEKGMQRSIVTFERTE
jgi:hypothetical protein